jgi:hypothetical protein
MFFNRKKTTFLKNVEKNSKKGLTNGTSCVIILHRIIILFFFGGILRFFRPSRWGSDKNPKGNLCKLLNSGSLRGYRPNCKNSGTE